MRMPKHFLWLSSSPILKPVSTLSQRNLPQIPYSCFCDTASTKAEGQLRLPKIFLMNIFFFPLHF